MSNTEPQGESPRRLILPEAVRRYLAAAVLGLFAIPVVVTPAHADAVCRDGWYSYSSGRGTCSWHGGVDYGVTPQFPMPTVPAAPPADWGYTPGLSPDYGSTTRRPVYLKRLKPGHTNSDSVRLLQKRLNKVLLRGSAKLPISGNYGKQTRAAVRLWQLNVDGATGRGADGVLSPRQARILFPAATYVVRG